MDSSGKTFEKANCRQISSEKPGFRQLRQTLHVSPDRNKQECECTFCGARISPGETECEECGMPVAGLKCPVCGAVSHNSFCVKCNTPLNRMAQMAVERAKQDPKFQEVCRLVEKAGQLREKMKVSGKVHVADEGERALLELLGGSVEFTQTNEDISREYEQTVQDIDKLFSEMLPPAGSTPQQQQNYYSARHICVTTITENRVTVKTPIAWICNYCGCRHNQPSECAEPYLGGTWVYETSEVVERNITKEIKTEE